MSDDTGANVSVKYLADAEKALFGRFISEVDGAEYERADKVLDLLDRLGII